MDNIQVVTAEDFCKVLADTCRKFADEGVKKKVKTGIRKIASEAKSEVTAKSRRSDKEYDGNTDNYKGSARFAKENSRPYKESWVTSTTEEKGVFRVIVHNKKWQLVHLLELGHVLRDGTGRVYGEVPAYEHVQSTYDNADKKVDELLEDL